MKKIGLFIIILFSCFVYSQVAIGKTSVSSGSISLEFGNGNRGLVLPWVNGTNNSTPFIVGSPISEVIQNGTLVYDASDKKIKIKYAAGWKDLSVDTTGVVDLSLQNPLTEKQSAKIQIGGDPDTDTTPGILVLADTGKAMVLPKVASPHLNIINPSPGTMVYDTVKKQLALFNGTVWSFWEP